MEKEKQAKIKGGLVSCTILACNAISPYDVENSSLLSLPLGFSHLMQRPIRMLPPVEWESKLHSRYPGHLIYDGRGKPEYSLPVESPRCPVIRAAEGALHAALAAREDEADGRTGGLEERCCHGTWNDLAKYFYRRRSNCRRSMQELDTYPYPPV